MGLVACWRTEIHLNEKVVENLWTDQYKGVDMIKVLPAVEDDIPWLLKELKCFSEFHGSKIPLFADHDHAVKVVTEMVRNHLTFVAFNGEERMGLIAGYVLAHPFNPAIRVLQETFWWVPEVHRGSRAGALLLSTFIDWGKANVDWVHFGLEAKSPVSDKCLLKRGFKLQERNYLLEV